MSPPKIILVPTDFSVAAESALDYALELAAKLGAKVYVMHAYQLPVVGFPDGVLLPSAEIATKLISFAQSQLAACVAKRQQQSSVDIVPLLKQEDPRDAVIAAAEDLSADLVIMGTHGRRGLVRALIGSVAEAVIRTSTIPVLTVHAATSRPAAA